MSFDPLSANVSAKYQRDQSKKTTTTLPNDNKSQNREQTNPSRIDWLSANMCQVSNKNKTPNANS